MLKLISSLNFFFLRFIVAIKSSMPLVSMDGYTDNSVKIQNTLLWIDMGLATIYADTFQTVVNLLFFWVVIKTYITVFYLKMYNQDLLPLIFILEILLYFVIASFITIKSAPIFGIFYFINAVSLESVVSTTLYILYNTLYLSSGEPEKESYRGDRRDKSVANN